MNSRLPLRVRVTAAFAVTTAVALVGLAAFVLYRVEATLLDQTRGALETQLDALARIPAASRGAAAAAMTGDTFAQVLTPEGEVVASSPQLTGRVVPQDQLTRDGDEVVLERDVLLADEDETEAAMLLLSDRGDQFLVVGTSQEDLEDALGGVLAQFLIGVPIVLTLASVAGYAVARSALRPVETMRQQAASISARSSAERLRVPAARDEIHRLGVTLNAMLDRLDSALKRERRFVAEASHEVRTPLALLRMELDLALSRPRTADELVAALKSADEEVERLTKLAENLLLLAASDEARLQINPIELDLGPFLQQLADRFSTRARSEGRRISVSGEFPLVLHADPARMDQALSNLVDNALRHGEGDVELTARSERERVSICVADQGHGVDDDFRAEAFDRFSRESTARTAGGRGLGLAIVRAIVEDHHGTVSIDNLPGRTGIVVRIELPLDRRQPIGQ